MLIQLTEYDSTNSEEQEVFLNSDKFICIRLVNNLYSKVVTGIGSFLIVETPEEIQEFIYKEYTYLCSLKAIEDNLVR